MTSGGDHWRPVQTCSFEDLPLPPTHTHKQTQEWHLVVATGSTTVSKRAVRILLECFLVTLNFFTNMVFFWVTNLLKNANEFHRTCWIYWCFSGTKMHIALVFCKRYKRKRPNDTPVLDVWWCLPQLGFNFRVDLLASLLPCAGYTPNRQWSCGKVIFSQASLSHSIQDPMW